jgi:hypothetical protein
MPEPPVHSPAALDVPGVPGRVHPTPRAVLGFHPDAELQGRYLEVDNGGARGLEVSVGLLAPSDGRVREHLYLEHSAAAQFGAELLHAARVPRREIWARRLPDGTVVGAIGAKAAFAIRPCDARRLLEDLARELSDA